MTDVAYVAMLVNAFWLCLLMLATIGGYRAGRMTGRYEMESTMSEAIHSFPYGPCDLNTGIACNPNACCEICQHPGANP